MFVLYESKYVDKLATGGKHFVFLMEVIANAFTNIP